ncbi:hypothetical protein BH10PSE13_BH10PSE13_09670 [soil metagenome]
MIATVLSCVISLATPNPALAGTGLLFNLNLTEMTATEMAAGKAPVSALTFADQSPAIHQWVVHNALDPSASPIMLGRVEPKRDAKTPLFMRWGTATRQADGISYRFEEKMHGPCRLISKDGLQ